MEKKRKLSVHAVIIISGLAFCALLYAAAAGSPSFADLYTDTVFIGISKPLAFLASAAPFSVGEVLIMIGIAAVIPGIPLWIAALIVRRRDKEKRGWLLKAAACFWGYLLLYIALTETLNCFIQYRCTGFADKYGDGSSQSGYSTEQLEQLCDILTDEAADLAELVPRDSEGEVYLPADVTEKSRTYMSMLGEDYSRLSGWYTRPKYIANSRFMSKTDLQGIYFPFTMEANINEDMCPARKPATMCHELAHTKGFILEDEAGFIAYLACRNSGDVLFEYSGTLSAMTYSVNRLYRYGDPDAVQRIFSKLTDRIRSDNKFLTDEYKKSLQEDKVIKTEKVVAVSDKAIDANLKINGVSDGKQSYGRMVDLLIEERIVKGR